LGWCTGKQILLSQVHSGNLIVAPRYELLLLSEMDEYVTYEVLHGGDYEEHRVL
jgi:hypothetical protein